LVLDQSATPNVIALGSGVADGATALEATAAGGVVSVTAEAGAAVNVVFSRSGGGSVTKSLIGDGTPQAIQLSPTDLNTLGDGEIIVVANQVDIAGNTASSSGSFRLDRSAPGAPQITSPSVTSKVLNHTIRGTAEANALVEVREGTTLLGTTKANAQGQWEALVFLGGQGSHSIQAYQTDQTGNRGPTASNAVVITVDVLGSAPTFTKEDLQFMLLQIGIAEAHNTRMGGDAGIRADFETDGLYNVEASQAFLRAVLGPGFDFEPLGLRSVEGFNNNLQPAQAQFGAADQSFSPATIGAVGVPTLNSNYDGDGAGANPSYAYKTATTSGNVTDSSPRLISNLIADQSTSNAAAVSASQEQQALLDPELQRSANLAALQPQLDPRTGQTIMTVLNVAPNPANAPYNSFLTLFGQGFDHGLDFIDKGGSGTVFVPILQGDPLYSTAPGAVNMIMVTRATVDANGNTTNRTTPWIDMNQAYASHASMQVFLRDYLRTGNQTLATGKLLEGSTGGLPNWADVKAQALSKLGIRLTDADVSNAPLLVTDEYGRFIPGVNGYAQVVVTTGTNSYAVLEGSEQGLALTGTGYAALRTNHAFLLDIAHSANPGSINAPKTADGDSAIGLKNADGTSPTPNGQGQYSVYDNELLDAHWIAGDGRVNENTGLTAFHTLFHNEHDRLVDDYKRIAVESGDLTFLNQWLRTPLNALPTSVAEVAVDNWNGERLFQAARFVVEMQYQHSVFEEFGRFIDPGIAEDTGYLPNLNPAITREFANVVYRFGHSMLNETVDRFTPDWQNTSQGLIAAFINPTAFTDPLNPDNNPATATYTAEQAAGQILRGMTRQQGNAIDEFTTGALRNNLIGLPLDLAAINLTRARELGIPRLNDARREFYAITNNLKLTPYQNWNDFANHLKHPASLINFVAAYGTHPELIKLRDPNTQGSDPTQTGTYLAGFTPATRLSLLRSKAMELIPPQSSTGLLLGGSGSHKDSAAFINATGSFANRLGGVDDIDFWIGGLAEKTEALVGMLGSTFSFVFTQQMQALQNADRLYYLRRLPGNLLTQVEQNTFSAMAQRTMDVTSLPGHVFSLPTYTLEVDPSKQLTNLGNGKADPVYANRANATAADIGYSVDNTIRWNGGHVVLVGSEARDLLKGGNENDTLYGRGSADVLIGGDGDDQIWGGDGDDFIFDSAGLNVLRGESGNDVMVGGSGLSLLFGGRGKDWMVSGTGGLGNELFGEEGDDFISASDAGSAGRGGAGDDWFEGNSLGGADGYSLDDGMAGLVNINGNAIPQAVGHDVSLSRAGDDKIFGDFGNDIFIDGSGIDDYAGQQGFDWVSFARNGRDPGGTANNGGAIDLSQIVPAGVVRATINADLTDLHVEAVGGSQYADVMIGDDRTDLVGGNVFLNRNNDLAINGLDRDLVAPFRSITLSDLVLQGNQRNPVVNTHYDLIVDPGTGQLVWGVAGGISVNRALDDRLFDLPLDSGGIKGLFSNYLSTAPSGGSFAALIPTALRQTQEVNTRPHPLGTGINIAPVIVGSVANSSVPGFPNVQGVIDVPAYFNAGNVLIGGAASDRFLGKAGDDVIDGDAWLNVELEWRNPINQQVVRFADMKAVNDANLVLGLAIKQEDLHIVRELCSNPFEADGTTRANDMAIYYGRPDEYLFEGQRRVYVASTPGGILETDPTPVDYQEDPNTGFPLNYPANGLGIPDVRERDLNGNLLTTTFDQNAFFNNFHPRTTIIGTPTDLDGDGFITITYAPTQAQISDPLRGLPPLNQGTDYLRNIETVRFVLPGVANPTGNASDLLSGLIAPTASSIYTSRIGSSGATYTYSTFRDGTFLDVDVKSFMPTTGAVLPSVSNGQTPIPDPDTNKVFNFQQASPALPTLSMRLTSDTGRSNSDNISQQAGITVTLPGSGNYLYQWSNSGDYFSPNWRALPAAATTGTPPTVSITQAQVNSAFGLSQGVNTLYFRLIENKDGGRIGDSQAFSFTYDTTAPGAPTQTGVGQTIGTQVSPDPWAYDAGGQLFYSQTGATGTFTSVSQPATKPYYVQVEDAAGNRGAVAKSQFFYDLQAGRYNDGNTASPGNNTAGTGYLLVSNYQPGEKFLVDPDATKYFFKDNYTTADGKTGIGVFKDDGTGNGGSIGSAIPGSWDGRDELLALIVKEDMIAQMFTVTETRDPITNTMISKSYGVDPSKLANWTFTASTSSSTRDALSGGQAGIFDTFRLGALNQALLPTTNTGSSTSFDRIIGLNANEDMIDSPFARTSPIKPTVNTKAVTALTTSAIAAVLTKSTFAANGAATFVFGTGTSTRTFLALNDATAGFGTADAVLEITGFTGSLSNLAVF
jgi:Ca2+-binding RTX toxin-like protein